MPDFQLRTPVALIIYNRSDKTERVLREIAKARPPTLLVVGDGPRADDPTDSKKVEAARAVLRQVDWDCRVLTNLSDVNLGCRQRVASGLAWVFDMVPEAIILEDDCVPHATFFRFCEELLEVYRDDTRIAMISGNNFQFGQNRTEASYYFSSYTHIWGWATWRRAWKHYDRDTSTWPAVRDGGWLNAILGETIEREYWTRIFQAVHERTIDSWAYVWTLSCWAQGMLTILPEVNLVSNIGFGAQATHTHVPTRYAAMQVEGIRFPLRHPKIVLPHREADEYTSRNQFAGTPQGRLEHLLRRIYSRTRSLLHVARPNK